MRPEVGAIVRVRYHAYRVLEIRELDDDNLRGPLDVSFKPYELIVEKLTGDDAGQHGGAIIRRWQHFRHLGEHYPVCNRCGEVPPCREQEHERYARHQSAQLTRALKVPEGACPACSEPISTRQKTHHFPGPNLLNPLASDGVTFHARRKCANSAATYEDTWVRADPTRERSLLTLRCTGIVTVHGDGTGECHGRNDGTDCPHILARHQGVHACYLMSAGCPIGCTPTGHPGTGLAPDLTPGGLKP